MKIHSSILKIVFFCLIFHFFVLMPIFTRPDVDAFSVWNFPLVQSVFFLLSLFILFTHKELGEKTVHYGKYFIFYDFLFPATFCTCLLFSISFLLNGIAILLKVSSPNYKISLPENIIEWSFCLLTFIFSASFEEVIYRFYLPEFILIFTGKAKKTSLIIETAAALLFALAHFYAGIFAVINGFFAHIILRKCYKKSGALFAGITAHFIYNFVQLFLAQL